MKDTIVKGEYQTELPTKNGIADQSNIDFIKQTVLFNAVRDKFDIVNAVADYPKDNKSIVRFSTEFVIMNLKKYNRLLSLDKKSKEIKLESK